MFNRGDTVYLILNYEINGKVLEEGAYDEIELQINSQGSYNSVKKLLSDGSIRWGTVEYVDENNETQSFTGYFVFLTQEETFKLGTNKSNVQLRVKIGENVGSSAISDVVIGNTLSKRVLNVTAD